MGLFTELLDFYRGDVSGWMKLLVSIVILTIIGYVFGLLTALVTKIPCKISSFTDPTNFTKKFIDSSTLSNKDNFSRDPVSAGSSVAWPTSPELLVANAATASAWGRETLKLYDPEESTPAPRA